MDRVRDACANKDPRRVCELLRARLADPRGLSAEGKIALRDLANDLEGQFQRRTGDGNSDKQLDTICEWIGRPGGEIDKSKYRSLEPLVPARGVARAASCSMCAVLGHHRAGPCSANLRRSLRAALCRWPLPRRVADPSHLRCGGWIGRGSWDGGGVKCRSAWLQVRGPRG